jgi:hypothetical protein
MKFATVETSGNTKSTSEVGTERSIETDSIADPHPWNLVISKASGGWFSLSCRKISTKDAVFARISWAASWGRSDIHPSGG